MLNNKKIRLMTKLSLYERKNESKELKAGKYYKSDYISLGLLNSAIVATLAFFIVIALFILVNIEELLTVITTLDFLEIGKVLVSSYLIYLIAYLFIVYIVYRVRYEKMSKGIKEYDAMLKELYLIYKKEANVVQETSAIQEEPEVNDGLDVNEEVALSDEVDSNDEVDSYDEESELMNDEELESYDDYAREEYEVDNVLDEDLIEGNDDGKVEENDDEIDDLLAIVSEYAETDSEEDEQEIEIVIEDKDDEEKTEDKDVDIEISNLEEK